MSRNKILIRLIGDTHCGSLYGLCPEEFILNLGQQEERKVNLSEAQMWVWEQFLKYAKTRSNPDYIVNLGDSIDGINYRGLGIGLITTNIDEQVRMATESISHLMGKKTQYLGVQGTHYHNSKASESEFRIAEFFNGRYYPDILTDIGSFGIDGDKILSFAHCNYRGFVTRSRGIEREIQFAQQLMAKRKIPFGTLFIARGHLHCFYGYDEFNGFEGVQNGCWKLVSPYATSKQPMRFRDLDIGAIDVWIHKDGTIEKEVFRPDIPFRFNNVLDMRKEMEAVMKNQKALRQQRQRKSWLKKGYEVKRKKKVK